MHGPLDCPNASPALHHCYRCSVCYSRAMTRPLRLEFPGALYHVTARGDRRKAIYHDDADRVAWLEIMRIVCARFHFVVHAYCQMTNHYHLMIETPEGNLAQGMRQLNAIYSQAVNRKHGLVGHLFQGRYKAILVQKESYLLGLARYVVLNPVRAGLVARPEDWRWSSHHIELGQANAPEWLETQWLLSQFGSSDSAAIEAYRQFVGEGEGTDSPLKGTQYQLVLGDESFVAKHRGSLDNAALTDVVKEQRRMSAMTLEEYQSTSNCRDEAMARAYRSTAYTMAEIGKHFGVSYKTVSRAVRLYESAGIGRRPNW